MRPPGTACRLGPPARGGAGLIRKRPVHIPLIRRLDWGTAWEIGLFGILRGRREQREQKFSWGIWNAWSFSPHRNVAQASRFAGSAVILPGSTVATRSPHPTESMLSRRYSVIVVPLQETTIMVARKNQAALEQAMYASLARS